MSTLETLSRQVRQSVLIESKDEKVTVRTKALDYLQSVFDERGQELQRILAPQKDNDFDWTEFFSQLQDIIKDQCNRLDSCKTENTLATAKNKNGSYESILVKCINLSNERMPNIAHMTICDAAFDCFKTPTMLKYFGACYLKIIDKHILRSKYNLDDVKVSKWSSKYITFYRYSKNKFYFNNFEISQTQQKLFSWNLFVYLLCVFDES